MEFSICNRLVIKVKKCFLCELKNLYSNNKINVCFGLLITISQKDSRSLRDDSILFYFTFSNDELNIWIFLFIFYFIQNQNHIHTKNIYLKKCECIDMIEYKLTI